GRDGQRTRLLLRVEQHTAGEPGLEPPVPDLAHQPDREQAPEPALDDDRAEVVRVGRVGEGRGGHALSVPVDLGPYSAMSESALGAAEQQPTASTTRRCPTAWSARPDRPARNRAAAAPGRRGGRPACTGRPRPR